MDEKGKALADMSGARETSDSSEDERIRQAMEASRTTESACMNFASTSQHTGTRTAGEGSGLTDPSALLSRTLRMLDSQHAGSDDEILPPLESLQMEVMLTLESEELVDSADSTTQTGALPEEANAPARLPNLRPSRPSWEEIDLNVRSSTIQQVELAEAQAAMIDSARARQTRTMAGEGSDVPGQSAYSEVAMITVEENMESKHILALASPNSDVESDDMRGKEKLTKVVEDENVLESGSVPMLGTIADGLETLTIISNIALNAGDGQQQQAKKAQSTQRAHRSRSRERSNTRTPRQWARCTRSRNVRSLSPDRAAVTLLNSRSPSRSRSRSRSKSEDRPRTQFANHNSSRGSSRITDDELLELAGFHSRRLNIRPTGERPRERSATVRVQSLDRQASLQEKRTKSE